MLRNFLFLPKVMSIMNIPNPEAVLGVFHFKLSFKFTFRDDNAVSKMTENNYIFLISEVIKERQYIRNPF